MKNIRKTLRFSEEEFAKIESEFDGANITFSEFARSAILQQKIKLPIEKELIYQLSKIGTNLNQIARASNSKQPNERIDILTELIEIEKQLESIRNGS